VTCPACGGEVLDIDVRCGACGAVLTSTGSHRLLGATVLGVYELVDVLGQGGMSVVFKGRHKLTDQEVALKLLPPELAAHSQVKNRFLEEAKALAALDHPNIVHLYNFGQENGSFVLAMQFVAGKTWERMIIESKRLDWMLSTKICVDVLKALEYAHSRGVVHRDMKPSNVLVRANDGAATVMDFGIAKMTTSTKLTATGQTMGTVRYMSPEQVRGQEVDLRTDIYSLGATLYESLVGDTPFDGETHFEIMTKHLGEVARPPTKRGLTLPAALEDALLKSLHKKPDDRFSSAKEFRVILEEVLAQADLVHGETQRMPRDFLRAASVAVAGKPETNPAVAATATPKAAEPTLAAESIDSMLANASAKPAVGRATLAGVAALVVAGAAAATWYFAIRKPAMAPPAALWEAPDAVATENSNVVELSLTAIAAADRNDIGLVKDSYVAPLRAMREWMAKSHPDLPVQWPSRVVVVSRQSVCQALTSSSADSCTELDSFPYFYRLADRTVFVVHEAIADPALRNRITAQFLAEAASYSAKSSTEGVTLRDELLKAVPSDK
jgi:tRNA A-37 threonylcarbamoyl transferase component Bud32